MSRVRLVPMILIAIISLAILLGGWRAYLKFDLVNPLQTTLTKIPGVQSVSIHAGNPTEIDIKLHQVADLQTTFLQISRAVSSNSSTSDTIVIEDRENSRLRNAYESLQPILFAGLRSGDYKQMIQDIDHQATREGLHSRITMDEKHVFVQLTSGSYYLYHIIPFAAPTGGVSA